MANEITARPIREVECVTIRFAGDSGDGMQLIGTQFSESSAVLGNDICVMPEFPAEIRAPAGTTYGVSGYQIQFSSRDIHTPGDHLDALLVMNAAALKVNLADLREGGLIIANSDGFNESNLSLAGYTTNPLEDGSLSRYEVYEIPITKVTSAAVEEFGFRGKAAAKFKNFYALGVVMWLYNRSLDPILRFIETKFTDDNLLRQANERALRAGWYYGETAEMFKSSYSVPKAKLPAGVYRNISGNQALAYGLVTAAHKCGKSLFYAGYPITPASDILHELARLKNYNVLTFQAEDEIAAVTACLGSAFGGGLAVTGTSGPGLALKMEAINLAVMTELPIVAVDVQRGGPSTGLPTKTEQTDLLQAIYGRNGESPVPVIAAKSPNDCFYAAYEACKIALQHMTPVILLSDAYLANGAEPWLIPNIDTIPSIDVHHPTEDGAVPFNPYQRDENYVRPWALPGTPQFQHRIGGLEKQDITGNVSYDPENHEKMVKLREAKVAKIAEFTEPAEVFGNPEGGEVLLVGWGSTFGSIMAATQRLRHQGYDVSMVHLRWVNPFPRNLGDILKRFRRIVVPELNRGQLTQLLRARYLVDAQCLSQVTGRPILVQRINEYVKQMLDDLKSCQHN